MIGYLLFLDSFEVVKTEDGKVPNKIISRWDRNFPQLITNFSRFVDRDLWIDVFRRLLNNNSNSTDWAQLASELRDKFVRLASAKKTLWNASVNEFNKNFASALAL